MKLMVWLRAVAERGKSTLLRQLRTRIVPLVRVLESWVLTADSNGKADLAVLQFWFFLVVLIGIIGCRFAVTGTWSYPPLSMLGLLGIPLAAAAAARAADMLHNRISIDDWFVRNGWLPPPGAVQTRKPRFVDLVVGDEEVDVYRFQSLSLTIIVGAAIMIASSISLEILTIPETLLGILGLSQGVYVAGKLVSPPSRSELYDATSGLIELEKDFVHSAARTPDPSPPPGRAPLDLPADIDAAVRRAGREKYVAYVERAKLVNVMFQAVMKRDTPPFVPRFRA